MTIDVKKILNRVKRIIRRVQPDYPEFALSHDEAIRRAVYIAFEDVLSRLDSEFCDDN